MNSRKILLTLGVAASLAGVAAVAQENSPEPQTAPASVGEIAAPAPADRVVYSTQLPSVPQLMQMAQAQGTTVLNVNQTSSEVTVTYRLANNSARTVSYQLLPTQTTNATSAEPVATSVQTPPPAPVPAPAPVQIVEVPAPETRVVYRYYDRYDPFYYDPFYWPRRAPISVNLGFGWDFGHRHYRHHHHRHHGWRRW